MTELRQALAEINAIRSQVARGTQFRGYGPGSTAFTGLLALAVAGSQAAWFKEAAHAPGVFLRTWLTVAAVAVLLAALEMIVRTRRVHRNFAGEMIHAAAEQFLPALVVGMLLTAVLMRTAPGDAWMLPGLWQILFCLGVFASCRFLPKQMFAVGVWYLVTGLTCLMIGGADRPLSPWAMGLPFGVGQLMVAAVLQFGFEDHLAEK
jgi:hypothetical protein